jgi:hypothetical protein
MSITVTVPNDATITCPSGGTIWLGAEHGPTTWLSAPHVDSWDRRRAIVALIAGYQEVLHDGPDYERHNRESRITWARLVLDRYDTGDSGLHSFNDLEDYEIRALLGVLDAIRTRVAS